MSFKALRGILVTLLLLVVPVITVAQNSISPVKPEEQTRMKPLIAAEAKAREDLNAKIASLPEAKMVQEAQARVKKATDDFNKLVETLSLPEAKAFREARDSLQKALDALNKSVEKLPENTAWKEAGAKSLDEAYKIMADHRLSSREYKPELDAQGQLVFNKLPVVVAPPSPKP